jgi:hypothetical protein
VSGTQSSEGSNAKSGGTGTKRQHTATASGKAGRASPLQFLMWTKQSVNLDPLFYKFIKLWKEKQWIIVSKTKTKKCRKEQEGWESGNFMALVFMSVTYIIDMLAPDIRNIKQEGGRSLCSHSQEGSCSLPCHSSFLVSSLDLYYTHPSACAAV